MTTILIHGWSDSSDSFRDLKAFLARHGIGEVEEIFYADYESREDSITFDDIVDGLNDRLIERGVIHRDGRKLDEVDVVVHSTGGLVIRHWIQRFYGGAGGRIEECPVRRVVMLAPANFGSPLAHRGKSFLGSLIKGRKSLLDFLEVGRPILSGLELGSPYQWRLAEGDVLVPEPWFHGERIQLTVLVGMEDYDDLRRFANKAGTDGTVVIAGAPLNTVKFVLDPCRPQDPDAPVRPYEWVGVENHTETAFGVVPHLNHGSIIDVFGEHDADGRLLPRLVLRALTTSGPAAFRTLRSELAGITEATYASGDVPRPRFQQFLVRAVDDQGGPIDDFTLEFGVHKASKRGPDGFIRAVRSSEAEERLSREATSLIAREFHRHGEAPNHRRFLVNPVAVRAFLDRAGEILGEEPVLSLTMHVPPIDRGIRYDTERVRAVALWPADDAQRGDGGGPLRTPTFFYPNTTTLLEIRVDRQNDYVTLGPRARKH